MKARALWRNAVVFASLSFLTACAATEAAETATGGDAQNMIGRQSQNEGLLVLPAPGKVTVDGDLKDWDFSGRIWVFADKTVRTRYSVEAAAMWDKTALYLGAKWRDPTPMHSLIDPEFNPSMGWKCDSWQMRFRTDKIGHATTWFFTPKKMPVFHIQYGKSMTAPFGGPGTFWVGAADDTKLGRGIEMAYRADADGKGFVQEIRIPWEIVWEKVPEIKPGLTFQLGNEFLWGDPSGKTWPIHRYADNMQAGVTSREFYWTNWRAWGEAKLLAKGKVPVRQYVDQSMKLQGTVPIRAELPADAASFTLAIEDEQGRRVRNMGGLDPADYTVETKKATVIVEVPWDGLTDRQWSGNWHEGYKGVGQLVKPGTYRVRGLCHKGLGAEYEMTFYNPGTPPWRTSKGDGAWGADHSRPADVARAGDWIVVSWPGAEGGSGIIAIAPDGRKRWGEKRGAVALSANETHVFAFNRPWGNEAPYLLRLDRKDGSYQPFVSGGKARPLEFDPAVLFGGTLPGAVADVAASDELLVLALDSGKLAVLSAETGDLLKQVAVPKPSRVAFAADGTLYAVSDGKLVRVDVASGKVQAVPTPGVAAIADVAVDKDGNVLVGDNGPDRQVKAFSPDGKLLYACGKKGGRPIRGVFDAQAVFSVLHVDADAAGNVWVVEDTNVPRRVSVWGRDGKLVRDYVGNTGYAGTGGYLHDTDPALGCLGPMEIKLDKTNRTWQLTQILWEPDPNVAGECFSISTGSHVQPQRFRSDASGKMREYLYTHDARDMSGQVVYMPRNGRWQPVSAICLAGHVSGSIDHHNIVRKMPGGELAGLNAHDGVFWNDRNKDGKVQRAECEIVPTKQPGKLDDDRKRGRGALSLSNGWGGRIDPTDFSIYADGIVRYKPVEFTDDGAPVYTSKSAHPLGLDESGDLVPVPGEDLLICLSWKGYAGPTRLLGVSTKTGKVAWRYPNPYPGVHGSHRAPMPQPGLLIGPLKTMGVIEINKEVGRVFAMRGNLGTDYYMTTDGLFVGSMFVDGRLPGDSLPDKEEQLLGMPMEGFSVGGEPFSGTLVKQDDGVVRTTTGMAREGCMILKVKGLETVKRFTAAPVKIDEKLLVKIDRDNAARAAAEAEAKAYTVKRLAQAPKIDGAAGEWKDVPALDLVRPGSPEKARARLACDAANLYVLFEVTDASAWKNVGKDVARLFKTGDAVDVQLSPSANTGRDPAAGDVRILFSQLDGKAVAVVMKPKDKAAPAGAKKSYTSPVGTKTFERLQVMAAAQVVVKTRAGGYVVEAAVPLADLGLKLAPGVKMRGDLGFISSDAAGRINTARTYWSNKQTNLVNDEPSEAWLYPNMWGELTFE